MTQLLHFRRHSCGAIVAHLIRFVKASVNMRTTINIDNTILEQVKRLQAQQCKPLGRVVSELLAQALAISDKPDACAPGFRWTAKPMKARVDLAAICSGAGLQSAKL